MVTVRPENRLGYYDKLIGLDSELVYNEVVEAGDPVEPLKLRYPIVALNYLASMTTRYTPVEFGVNTAGAIVWQAGKAPAKGTRLSVHYHTLPFWIVQDHPKSTRTSWTARKKKITETTTQAGDLIDLPVQALVRYDFLR